MTEVQTLHMARGLGYVQRASVPAGQSVAEIARAFYGADPSVTAWVRAPAGYDQEWVEIPGGMWPHVRPKSELRFSYRPAGDFFDDVTDFFSDVASSVAGFASDVYSAVVDPVAEFFSGPSVSSLAYGQPQQAGDDNSATFANVDSDNNLLRKADYLPIVVGDRRISPPELAQPRPYLDEGIQTFGRIFALDGHHSMSDIQVDGAPVADNSSITTETLDGAETTTTTSTLVTKVSNAERVNETLPNFTLDGTDLVDQDTPSDSEPRWVRFRTIFDSKLEEITLRLRVEGMLKSTDATVDVCVPIRIRFREKGSSGAWTNLPEIHLHARSSQTILQEFRIRWDSDFGELTHVGDIEYEFFQRVPEQDAGTLSDSSTGDQWQAAAHFVAGAGLRDTQNIQADRNGVRVQLDEAVNAKASFEWEVIRGIAFDESELVTTSYAISGVVYPFFLSYTTGTTFQVYTAQSDFLARLSLDYAVSLVNRAPCQRPKTALIALTSRGQSVRNITVLANRYVSDWSGSAWDNLTTTKNPATHYRQLLYDWMTYHAIDTDLIVNADFVSWRAECATRGYEVSAVFSGTTTRRALELIAAAGFARPRFSDGFGIDWFRDRSSERPVQTFSPRNTRDISLRWSHPPEPAGARCTFQDEDDGYRDNEVQVANPFYTSFQGYEVRPYPNISSADLVRRRATFDMLQQYYQGRRTWTVDASIEGLICERGDMVGIVTDLLDDANSGARVREVISDTTLRVDQKIPAEGTTSIFGVSNIFDPANIFTVGEESICLVSTPTGTEQRSIVGAADDVIRVDTPFSSEDLLGAHIAIGPASHFTRRCVVDSIRRQDQERATVTCLDEAPEVWREMEARFYQ